MEGIKEILEQKKVTLERNVRGEVSLVDQMGTNITAPDEQNTLAAPAQVSLIPLSDHEVVEVIRPETNLEKHQSFIFPHPKSKDLDKERTLTFPVTLPDGRDVEGKIIITPAVNSRCATTMTYDVYLALLSIWNDKGLPEEPFVTSLREVIKKMNMADNGRNYDRVFEECRVMHRTNISWVFSYSGNDKYESGRDRHILTVFDYNRITERSDISTKNDQTLRVQFHESIRENHRRSNTIPILWSERKKITSSITRQHYSDLDRILYYQNRTEITGTRFVEKYHLTPSRYKYKSQRLHLLQKQQKQLDGAILSNFHALEVYIEETADGSDYKLVERRGDKRELLNVSHNLPILPKSAKEREYIVEQIVDALGTLDYQNKTFLQFAKFYSGRHIQRAIGEYKAEAKNHMSGKPPEEKSRYFTAMMHRIAHDVGLEWIIPCEEGCKYRETNKLI